jgi:hypothetical protein
MQTDRTIPNNEPDIIIRDNEKGTCMLRDVAISGDRNVIKKEAEDILKYVYNINGAVGNLNGVKPNEGVLKCIWGKFKWEEVKCQQV